MSLDDESETDNAPTDRAFVKSCIEKRKKKQIYTLADQIPFQSVKRVQNEPTKTQQMPKA